MQNNIVIIIIIGELVLIKKSYNIIHTIENKCLHSSQDWEECSSIWFPAW